MAVTVKQIIIEALARTNLCSRRQAAPAHLVEDAFRMLKGVTGTMETENLLAFTYGELDHTPETSKVTIGDEGCNVNAPDVAMVTSVLYKIGGSGYQEMLQCSPDQIYSNLIKDICYCVYPTTDTNWVVQFTDAFVKQKPSVKFIYNKRFTYELNDTLYIPMAYAELFTIALCIKLAEAYPRLSSDQITILKTELEAQKEVIKVPNRTQKYLTMRMDADEPHEISYRDIITGEFLRR